MTILTEDMKIEYTGDGSTVDFDYTFPIPSEDEVIVQLTTSGVVTLPTYTITGIGNASGGTVTMASAPASGSTLLIKRDVELTQEADYTKYDSFPAEAHELALDRIVMMVQQVNDLLNYVVSGDYEGVEMPTFEDGKYWRWEEDLLGNKTIVADTPVATTAGAATDLEVTTGTGTDPKVYTPAQLKLGVETHQHKIVHATSLPGTPDANTIYLTDT